MLWSFFRISLFIFPSHYFSAQLKLSSIGINNSARQSFSAKVRNLVFFFVKSL